MSPQHIVTQIDISLPLSADIEKNLSSAIYSIYYTFTAISAPIDYHHRYGYFKVIDCSCLDINMRHAPLQAAAGHHRKIISRLISRQDSTASIAVHGDCASASVESPILITDGNAVLTDDGQIPDFHGTLQQHLARKTTARVALMAFCWHI